VLLLGLRQPAWAAKQLATVDALSGGRLLLGVGVGGEHPEEFAAAGVPVAERGRRLDEALALLPELLGGRPVAHAGPTLELDAPALEPALPRMPPLLVGGRGETALRRAARVADGWLPMWLAPDAIAQRRERLAELAAEHGRHTPKVALLLLVHVDDDLSRARHEAAEHLEGQYRMPLHVVERWAALGPAERVAGELRAYRDAGVDAFVLMPLGRDPLEQYARLADLRPLVGEARAPVAADPNPGGDRP
jgi:alkanesulfonate monooxygenase SsuD/methylene tetrahydromethanopterin reductase-like flavin-dependent oxidoreductase (luciferase family)